MSGIYSVTVGFRGAAVDPISSKKVERDGMCSWIRSPCRTECMIIDHIQNDLPLVVWPSEAL